MLVFHEKFCASGSIVKDFDKRKERYLRDLTCVFCDRNDLNLKMKR